MKYFFPLVLFILLSSSCDPEKVQRIDPGESFFDLDNFFKEELAKLSKIDAIEKTVEINGKRETKDLSQVDLTKELSIFSDADINRVAWKDKYQVDSTINNLGELSNIQYTAIDENMKTQSLRISFQKKSVDSIFIKNQITGFATQNEKEMVYITNKGYSIKSYQKTLLGANQGFGVDVKFID